MTKVFTAGVYPAAAIITYHATVAYSGFIAHPHAQSARTDRL